MAVAAGAAFGRGLGAQPQPTLSLRVQPENPLALVPNNFIGLGYEMSSVAQTGLFSAQNTQYVRLVRNLGREGVVRLGGIVSDYTRYAADGPSRSGPKDTVIARADLERLRGFLDATGWTALWSVNFGRGSLDEAVVEARAVHQILGPRLTAIELGNEVENYGRGAHPLRTAPWDFAQYLAEYRRWHGALAGAIPGVRFAAPDTAASVEWVEEMASDARGEVQLLTTHYYRGDQHKGTLEQLTQPDSDLEAKLDRLRQVSRSSGIPWRMCETNSFFGGGRPGLSDTFAGALWTLNYLLLLAQSGCAGVNIETGFNQLGFMSSYSPIHAESNGNVQVGAPYYGMLAFAAAGVDGAEMFPAQPEPHDPDVRVYAIGRGTRVQAVVVINWSESREASVSVTGAGLKAPLSRYTALRLTAPSLTSKEGIRLGDAEVDRDGYWSPSRRERVGADRVAVAPASAVVLSESG